MEKIAFPQAQVGEWTVFRKETPFGMFFYKLHQAANVTSVANFNIPNSCGKSAKDYESEHPEVVQPLTALAVFMHVVALEDLLRESGVFLVTINELMKLKGIKKLTQVPVQQKHPHQRTQKDSFSLLDLEQLNDHYQAVLGIAAVEKADISRLRDLILMRHIVAHNAAIVREVDQGRFQYYAVPVGISLNPTAEFVRDTTSFISAVARQFIEKIRAVVFQKAFSMLPDWRDTPCDRINELIAQFDYFGLIPQSTALQRSVHERETELLDRCYSMLLETHGARDVAIERHGDDGTHRS
jgi:hypothetical protein